MATVVQAQSTTINEVQIDSLALLKIVRHCKESLPDLVSGVLLGLDVNGVLQISNCFPQVENDEVKDERFSLDMIQAFGRVNAVANTVGWYRAVYLSDHLDSRDHFIRDQFNYQSQSPLSVCIVYDPYTTEKGRLPLKALRLTPAFMEFYASNKPNSKNTQSFKIQSSNIVEEIPIKVKSSALAHSFFYELNANKLIPSSAERLNTSNSALIEKLIDVISGPEGCIDNYSDAQEKYRSSMLGLARQKLELTRKIESINEENERRKRNNRELLPVAELIQAKASLTEPSRVESLTETALIDVYGQELTNLAGVSYTNQAILASFIKSGTTDEA